MTLNVTNDWSGNSSPAPCESLTAEAAKRLTADATRDSRPQSTKVDDWKPGRIILRPGGDYEVRAVVEAGPGDNFRAYLVIEQFSANR
jgi:hypothetical protein